MTQSSTDPSQKESTPNWTLINKLSSQLGHPSVLLCTSSTVKPPSNQKVDIRPISPEAASLHQQSEPFVVVYNCLDSIGVQEGGMLLGRLKNLITPNILVITSKHSSWQLTDFIALGFKGIDSPQLSKEGLRGYYYDLNAYNHKRTWNNPKFWANPENFNKFRW